MTPWRAEQLWQLYLMVYNELTRELETERIETLPPVRPSASFLQGFPDALPAHAHAEAEIDAHIALEAAEPQARRGGGRPQRWRRRGS